MAALKISKRAVDDGKRERAGACPVSSDLIRADKGSVVGIINKMNYTALTVRTAPLTC